MTVCGVLISLIMCLCISQVIQLLSAVDPDDPVEGHHFYFSMVPEKHINPNFTIRDNQGCIHLDNKAQIMLPILPSASFTFHIFSRQTACEHTAISPSYPDSFR